MLPKESALTAKALRYLRERGAFAEKIGSGQRTGMPDIVACYRGRFLALETKRSAKEGPSPTQLEVLHEVRAAGGVGVVLYALEPLKRLLDEIDYQATR